MNTTPPATEPAPPMPMLNPVAVDRWALLHLVLSVGMLPESTEAQARDDLRRCLAVCVAALAVEPAVFAGAPAYVDLTAGWGSGTLPDALASR